MMKAICTSPVWNENTGLVGDAAYELSLFPFLPLILRFWDSDEDFLASLEILVDENILDYMHYETLMFAISHLLNRLKDER